MGAEEFFCIGGFEHFILPPFFLPASFLSPPPISQVFYKYLFNFGFQKSLFVLVSVCLFVLCCILFSNKFKQKKFGAKLQTTQIFKWRLKESILEGYPIKGVVVTFPKEELSSPYSKLVSSPDPKALKLVEQL